MSSAILYAPAVVTAQLSTPLSECTQHSCLMPLPEFYHHPESWPQVLTLCRGYRKQNPLASLQFLALIFYTYHRVLNLKYPRNRFYYQKQIEKKCRQVKILAFNEASWIYKISREVSKGRSARQAYFF